MAPWLAQRRLSISACAPSVRQLNNSLLFCVWRIPFRLPTMHVHAAHTFMPTCFRHPHMGRTLAAPVLLRLFNTSQRVEPVAQGRYGALLFHFLTVPCRRGVPFTLVSSNPPGSARTLVSSNPPPPFAPVSPGLSLCGSLSYSLPPILSCSPLLFLSCCTSLFLSHCALPSLSLSLFLSPSLSSPKKGVRVVRCISIPPGVRTILHGTEEVWCIH